MGALPIDPIEVQDPKSLISPSDLRAFKDDLKTHLRGMLGQPGGSMGHMVKYLYSSVLPEGADDTGADLWNRVLMHDKDYYIPDAEGKIIVRNNGYFKQLFAERPSVVDLGVGDMHALILKSIPTLKAVNAGSYVGFDINESFAVNAANIVKMSMPGVNSRSVHGDFTKPHKVDVDAPILMTMYGCTLSQFPLEKKGATTGETTLGELLTNIGNMVGFNAIMIATIDAQTHGPSARECYTGQHMDEFQRHFWRTVKTLLESDDPANNNLKIDGSLTANPADAVVYAPRFEGSGVVHRHLTQQQMSFTVDGEKFGIPCGTRSDKGVSEKWGVVADVAKASKKAGWTLVNELSTGTSTVRALVLAGREVSEDQKLRAAGKIANGNIRNVHSAIVDPVGPKQPSRSRSTSAKSRKLAVA